MIAVHKVAWAKANLNHTAQGCCHYRCFYRCAYRKAKSRDNTEWLNVKLANGDGRIQARSCSNTAESSGLDDKTKSLVLINYFHSMSSKKKTCENNSRDLINMLRTCYTAPGNRWANFVVVDYYKRSEGGGSFQAVDTFNGSYYVDVMIFMHVWMD
ncbi:hypothetical protein PVK06_005011 [Gossypium arboreum]|uniref:Uncharacterized protein n=1 Tax=Gossypium arboreum TaxID=29729 RepID=A0ABR0QUQ7_GOSAR|nr:hypothetical protein PVK06_005011 [Gossypium arboreum]